MSQTDARAVDSEPAVISVCEAGAAIITLMTQNPPLTRLALAYNSAIPEAPALANAITETLAAYDADIVFSGAFENSAELPPLISKRECGALIVLGGDGTMLRASHLCAPAGVPILGINLGLIGFLMELQRDEWREYLPRLLKGDYRLEERMLLCAEHRRAEQSLGVWLAVNEAAICRGQYVRPIRLKVSADGFPVASYVADGLIASTPTGSTAYALAAGGPILPPELRNILLVPLAPHLSPDQTVVLSEGSGVTVSVFTAHEAVLSIDGHPPVMLADGDTVRVTASDTNLRFIRFLDPGYFYRNLNRFLEQNPSV